MLTINTVEDLIMKPQYASTLQNTPLPGDDENLAPKHSPLQKQWIKSHKMTPLQLLDTLRNAISAEEYMLRFDYISLHTRCLRLLRTLRTALDDQLRDRFGPNYIDDERQLCYVIYYIFKEAAEPEEIWRDCESRNYFRELDVEGGERGSRDIYQARRISGMRQAGEDMFMLVKK